MIENKVQGAVNLKTVREMVDSFHKDKLYLPALKMKLDNDYWTISYEELQHYVRYIGNALLRMGIKKGDKIGVIGENRSEWIITYMAVTAIGAIIVPYDILLKPDELLHVVKAGEVDMIFCSNSYFEKIQDIAEHIKNIKKIINFDMNDSILTDLKKNVNKSILSMLKDDVAIDASNYEKVMAGTIEKEREEKNPFKNYTYLHFNSLYQLGKALYTNNVNEYEKVRVEPDDIAAIIFTSGTTGLPKGVMLSHYNLLSNADAVQQTNILGPGDNWVIVLPLHHTYPTILGVFVPFLTYAFVTPVPTLRPNILIQTMMETNATCVPAAPILVEKIYKGIFSNVKEKGIVVSLLFTVMFALSAFFKIFGIPLGKVLFGSVRRKLGLQKLKFFISGGGPIPKEIIEGMALMGIPVMQGYGLTETAPVVSTTSVTHNRIGSVGLKLVNVEVKIQHPDEYGNGEILIRGPNLMQGYYKMPDKTAEVIDEEGWFHSGDIGMIDKDGFLYITGRIKNVIVSKGGKNIYPEEIENAILQSQYIAEAVIIGKMYDGGELPYAIVYPNFEAITALGNELGKTFSNNEIEELIGKEIKHWTKNLANYKTVKGFEITMEELPKTSSRKVKRFMFGNK